MDDLNIWAVLRTKHQETGSNGYIKPIETKQKTQHNISWKPLYANKHK